MNEIKNIEDLLVAMQFSVTPAAAPNPTFYVNIDERDLSIKGISPQPSFGATDHAIPISFEFAEKFLTGQELISYWAVKREEGEYSLVKIKGINKPLNPRVDSYGIIEIERGVVTKEGKPEVIINIEDESVKIYYNGEKVKEWDQPLKLYFTAKGDPVYLKCAFTLDVSILNELKRANKLKQWPNPIVIPIIEAEDCSVFTSNRRVKIVLK